MIVQQRPAKLDSIEPNRRAAPAAASDRVLAAERGIAHVLADAPLGQLGEAMLDFALESLASSFGTITYIEEAGEPEGVNDYAEIWLRRGGAAAHAPERKGKTPSPVSDRAEPGICNRPYVLAAGPLAVTRSMRADFVFRGRRCGSILVAGAVGDYAEQDLTLLQAIAERAAPAFWALAVERARTRIAAGYADSRGKLDSILNTAVDAVIGVRADGRIVIANPAASRLFGYTADELLGRKLKKLLPNLSRRDQEEYRWRVLETGQSGVFYTGKEERALRKDGSDFQVEISVGVAGEGENEIFLGIMRDITRRKAAEAELARRAEELARSNRELDDFAYIASHDLKAPLRGIHNYANFLIEDYGDKLDEDGRGKLLTLGRLAKRMEDIINDLLTFSRVGRTEESLAEVDLNAVLADVLESLKVFLEEAKAKVTVADPLPRMHCDQVRVRAVFHNLITNGVKYNDNAEKQIRIGWDENAEGEIVFSVSDNGIGIPEKHRDKVFSIFKRLHSGDKYGGGTGAGLAIVKKIVEQHRGRIWLDSEPGQGTTFHFTLDQTQASGTAP
ncbi:MAG TPA: ATP-binding protein [Alphaproteobacteria bacterium]|jgi:PAS domain S-box-containing protein